MSRRIESKTSRTAEYTCLVRCLSNLEERLRYPAGRVNKTHCIVTAFKK